jgi:HK97 family phage portal protein
MIGMQILGPDGRPFENSLEDPRLSLDDPKTWEAIGIGAPTKSGVRLTPKTALGYPPLWRALNLISGDVARLPLQTYLRLDDGGKEPAREHPAYTLTRRRANPVMRASAFKRVLTYHALLRGNGLAAIVRDRAGRPRQLLVLDPDQFGIAVVAGDLWYFGCVAGDDVRLPARDVFHIKGLSHNGVWGLDVVDVMREALGLPIAAREFMSSFFGSGSNQSGVLMVPQAFNDEKMANTLRMWNEMSTGLAKSHKVGLLQDNVKFVPTSVKPKESETTPILEHEIRTVSAITGCPPHKLGDMSRTSRNSLEEENQSYLDDCLDPWLNEWEEEADLKLLSTDEQESEEFFHEFNRNARLRTDATARGTLYKTLREIGVLTGNDIARKENMPTFGPEGDIRYVPANWVQLGTQPKQVKAAQRKLIAGVLQQRGKIEREKVTRAAAKAPEFAAWLDAFYPDHLLHLVDALAPARRVVEASRGKRLAARWKKLLGRCVSERQQQLREACGRVTPEELAAEVERVCGTWSHAPIVNQLLGE